METPDMVTATVIGDLFYDHVCDLGSLAGIPQDLGHVDFDTTGDISGVVGWGAVQFALSAADEGFSQVKVVGKVGSTRSGELDIAGSVASAILQQAGVEPVLAHDENVGTGQAIISYLPGDHRYMVSDPGANASFSVADITCGMRQAVTRGGLVYVSGYALVHPPRRQATVELIQSAAQTGATVALDLVPHDLDRFVNPASIRSVLKHVDWIFSAEITARRLLGVGPVAPAQAILAELRTLVGTVALFSHPSQATVASGDTERRHEFDYVSGASSRGQSARSHAQLLARYLLDPDER
jgi:sugar/nucleoside kinase (ribokinase family)